MRLEEITNHISAARLDELYIAAHSSCAVRVEVNDSAVLADTFTPWGGGVTLYGLGELVRAYVGATEEPVAPVLVRAETDGAATVERRFAAVVTPLRLDIDPDRRFLTPVSGAVVPPGSLFSLTATGAGVADGAKVRTRSGADRSTVREFAPAHFSPEIIDGDGTAWARWDIAVPEEPGLCEVTLGARRFVLYVTAGTAMHRIDFLNCFNARDSLWLAASAERTATRKADTLRVGGRPVEYDIRVTDSFEFKAKGAGPLQSEALAMLPWGRDIRIDGVAVTVAELKAGRDPHGQDAGECSFTAEIAGDAHALPGGRIFTAPYDPRFS